MKCKFFGLALLFLLAIPTAASANGDESICGEAVVNAVGKFLRISKFERKEESAAGVIIAEACKPSPQDKNVILATFAYDLFDKNHPDEEFNKEHIVAMVDVVKKQVISSYQVSIGEDAITEVGASSFTIDTGRYQLASNSRAFGLRFHSSAKGASCGEAAWGDELTLFGSARCKFTASFKRFAYVLHANAERLLWLLCTRR